MKKIIFIVLSAGVILISALIYLWYRKEGLLTIYIENSSMEVQEVDLKVYIDGRLVVDSMYTTNKLGADFDIHEFTLSRGPHTLRVKSDLQKLEKSEDLVLEDKLHIFVNFIADSNGIGNTPKEGAVTRMIEIHKTDKKPLLH